MKCIALRYVSTCRKNPTLMDMERFYLLFKLFLMDLVDEHENGDAQSDLLRRLSS